MRIFGFFFAILVFIPVAWSQPAGYYSSATGLTGNALQQALHNIIKDHQEQTYASLYDHFESTDSKPNLMVWDMYSDIPGGTPPYIYYYNNNDECGNYSGEGQCYNREHSFPASWFNNGAPMYTDLFHLYPTDGYVNNRRSNYPFGEVSSATWTSMNGSKVGNNSFPGYNGVVFEPIDEYKGDFARTCFYMAVRYYGQDNGWTGSPMTNGSQLKAWALNLMKSWHVLDPVSAKEISRNNSVYAIQDNRNPFIDHPEYVGAIWGGVSAIEEIPGTSIVSVFPVPVESFCRISFSKPLITLPVSVLYDPAGRKVNAGIRIEDGTMVLETLNLAKGFYFFSVQHEDIKPSVIKIIK